MDKLKLDALALEYQREYGTASDNVDIFYFMDNPAAEGIFSIFSRTPSTVLRQPAIYNNSS